MAKTRQKKQSHTLLSNVKHHLTKINTHTALAQLATKRLIADFPAIPQASDLLGPLLAPSTATSTATASSFSSTSSDHLSLSYAEPALSHASFASTTTQLVSYDSFPQLCQLMLAISSTSFNHSHMHNPELPLEYVKFSKVSPSASHIDLLSPDAAVPAMGPGLLLWKCPCSLDDWASFLLQHKARSFSRLQSYYVSFFQLENGKPLALKNIFAPHLISRELTALGARAVSRFPDGRRFFFHPLAHPYMISGNPEIHCANLLENSELHERLKNLDNQLKKKKTNTAATANEIERLFTLIVGSEPPSFPSYLANSQIALQQLCETVVRSKPVNEEDEKNGGDENEKDDEDDEKPVMDQLINLATHAEKEVSENLLDKMMEDMAKELTLMEDTVLREQAKILRMKMNEGFVNDVKIQAKLTLKFVVKMNKKEVGENL